MLLRKWSQCIDVIVVAMWKAVLYNLWANLMVEGIKQGRIMEASWNYIAPSRTQVIKWVMEAWDGPTSRVTAKAIRKGASLCYMTSDLDERVSKWDHCEKDDDYAAYA